MNDLLTLMLMVIAGALLAAVYLAGLWFTVRHIHMHHHLAVWLVTSTILRLGLVLLAFYFILSDQHWQHLLAALAGFIMLRSMAIRRVRRHLSEPFTAKEKAS